MCNLLSADLTKCRNIFWWFSFLRNKNYYYYIIIFLLIVNVDEFLWIFLKLSYLIFHPQTKDPSSVIFWDPTFLINMLRKWRILSIDLQLYYKYVYIMATPVLDIICIRRGCKYATYPPIRVNGFAQEFPKHVYSLSRLALLIRNQLYGASSNV